MGCMLSAASCNKWWSEEILKTTDFAAEQAQIEKLGENHVFFLPYLMGERSPHNNPDARASAVERSFELMPVVVERDSVRECDNQYRKILY